MKYGLTIDTGPSIKRETTMEQFIGLDVSSKDTFLSVREDGQRTWRSKCPSDPKLIAEVIRKRAPNAERVVFETGRRRDHRHLIEQRRRYGEGPDRAPLHIVMPSSALAWFYAATLAWNPTAVDSCPIKCVPNTLHDFSSRFRLIKTLFLKKFRFANCWTVGIWGLAFRMVVATLR